MVKENKIDFVRHRRNKSNLSNLVISLTAKAMVTAAIAGVTLGLIAFFGGAGSSGITTEYKFSHGNEHLYVRRKHVRIHPDKYWIEGNWGTKIYNGKIISNDLHRIEVWPHGYKVD